MCHGPEKERVVNPDYEFIRDYSALNKAALEAGMTNAKDQSRFRFVNFPFISNLSVFFE
jgi:cilia- and flagella-associated protein 77